MPHQLVSDALWAEDAPLLPSAPGRKWGRPRAPDRAALAGIIFVLKSGIPWRMLPREIGYGSGVTCWRRLRDWQAAGRQPHAGGRGQVGAQAMRGPEDRRRVKSRARR